MKGGGTGTTPPPRSKRPNEKRERERKHKTPTGNVEAMTCLPAEVREETQTTRKLQIKKKNETAYDTKRVRPHKGERHAASSWRVDASRAVRDTQRREQQ